MGFPAAPVRYVTEISCPGQMDIELDALIHRIARVNRGSWISSGYNFTREEGSVAYSFRKEEAAQAFGREATSTRRGIMRAKVDTACY